MLIRENKEWLIPVLVFVLIAPFTPGLDLKFSSYFYENNSFSTHGIYTFGFDYASYPAMALALFFAVMLIFSFFKKSLIFWRKPAIFMLLSFIVGAGLITHGILKDYWGRPRPKQIEEFGGRQEFRPFYKPNFFDQPEPSKSFSCGHCTMGFYFFSLALLGKRLKMPRIYILGILLAIIFGVFLSLTRIAQGGHFFSDTLATALIMWLTAYACDRYVFRET